MLEQSTTLRPFMQKFIMLALIAAPTGNNKVRWVIGSATRKRNHMIDVVSFWQCTFAIVAPAFLPLVLRLNVLDSVSTTRIPLSCPSSTLAYSIQFKSSIWMLFTPLLSLFFYLIWILLPPLTGIVRMLLNAFLIEYSLAEGALSTIKPSSHLPPRKVWKDIWFHLSMCLAYIWLRNGRFSLISARLATGIQSVLVTRIGIEEITCGRKEVLALNALPLRGVLGYHIVHGKGHSFSSCSRRFQPLGSNIILVSLL